MSAKTAEAVTISPLAGKPAPREMLADVAQLEREYYTRKPDVDDPTQLVLFGTSGHRGSPLTGSFTEAHIGAITQAICDYRRGQGTDGPLYLGKDTHTVSGPAQRTALEVRARPLAYEHMKRLARELVLMGCEVVTGAEPHLADPVALDTPGYVAGVNEALAIIREYHGQWVRDRASKGAVDGGGEATRRRQP